MLYKCFVFAGVTSLPCPVLVIASPSFSAPPGIERLKYQRHFDDMPVPLSLILRIRSESSLKEHLYLSEVSAEKILCADLLHMKAKLVFDAVFFQQSPAVQTLVKPIISGLFICLHQFSHAIRNYGHCDDCIIRVPFCSYRVNHQP